jgi:hypothetical protein
VGVNFSSGGFGVYGEANGTASGFGVYGNATSASPTGPTYGVYGTTAGSSDYSAGVYGTAGSTTDNPIIYGVYGQAASKYGVGAFGQNGTLSSTGAGFVQPTGVWGDGGASGAGVTGTVDQGVAGWFEANAAGNYSLWAINDNASGYLFTAYNSANNRSCVIDQNADFSCQGTYGATVSVEGGKRAVALSAIESPKNWFEDFGSGQLSKGSAVVAIDPEFAQTVNAEKDYMVIPVPNGDCKGLYVANKTPTSFEIRELGGGTSNIRFDYRIVVLRKNYEDVRFADHTNDPDPTRVTRMRHGRPQAPPSAPGQMPSMLARPVPLPAAAAKPVVAQKPAAVPGAQPRN